MNSAILFSARLYSSGDKLANKGVNVAGSMFTTFCSGEPERTRAASGKFSKSVNTFPRKELRNSVNPAVDERKTNSSSLSSRLVS